MNVIRNDFLGNWLKIFENVKEVCITIDRNKNIHNFIFNITRFAH